jgi:hypothetical protein
VSCKRSNELSWLAGVIEKGCTLTINRGPEQCGRPLYIATMCITSKSERLVREAHKIIGHIGKFTKCHISPNGYRYTFYRISLYAQDMEFVLNLVMPYLRAKKNIAQYVLKFRKTYAHAQNINWNLRYKLFRKIKSLRTRKYIYK